jgi:hypothetical protein
MVYPVSCLVGLPEHFNPHTKTAGSETECLANCQMLFSSEFGIIFPEKVFQNKESIKGSV